MDRRTFMKGAVSTAVAATLTKSLFAVSKYDASSSLLTRFPKLTMLEGGRFYDATIPDTLNLVYRAQLAISGMIGTMDPEHDYEVYQLVNPTAKYGYFTHENTGFPTINPKYSEALPMMRIMTGNKENMDVQNAMMEMMLSRIKEPGLYYVPPGTDTFRLWCKPRFGGASEWSANVYGNARLLLGTIAWYQYTGDPHWKEVIKTLSQGLIKTAVKKDDYAFYPDGGHSGEPFSYYLNENSTLEKGWSKDLDEAPRDDDCAGESLFMYTGGQARALARCAVVTGDEESLDMSGRICRFMLKRRYWGIESWGKRKDVPDEKELYMLDGPGRGLWRGHTAGRLEALRGLTEYGVVADDAYIKDFVQSAFNWMQNYGFSRVGYFPVIFGMNAGGGACGLARAIAIAIKLTEAGTGDYWEYVDRWARNLLVSGQRLPGSFSEEDIAFSATAPKIPVDGRVLLGPGGDKGTDSVPGSYTTDHVLQRCIGTFGHGCCTSNASMGLYYAWEAAVRYEKPMAKVNLLLNRASPWVDVNSYLPCEGKVVLHNKIARKLAVRIPAWVRERKVRCRLNEKDINPNWLGRYLIIEDLKPGDMVQITFPMVTEQVTYVVNEAEHVCTFKGNSLIDGFTNTGSKNNLLSKAPEKQVKRYVHPSIIEW